jgi:hypothetical protein
MEMSDERRPRKRPITGRSTKDRANDRANSAAKAEAVAKKRRAAIETRVNIAVGAKAMSLAGEFPLIRRVIASAAAEHKGTDLGETLKLHAEGADPLDCKLGYIETWDVWLRVQELETEINDASVALQPMMSEDGPPAEEFEDQFRRIATLAEEWESLIGAEHPGLRLLRLTTVDHSLQAS